MLLLLIKILKSATKGRCVYITSRAWSFMPSLFLLFSSQLFTFPSSNEKISSGFVSNIYLTVSVQEELVL